jgi:acyl-CoA synthetase (AMP-forming)/AMP-acid ligase II
VILGEIFERNAALFGDQTAIYFNDHTVTHATLLAHAYQLGNALLSLGLRRQDRVAILAQNCVETLELIVAAGLTGITCVGLNYRLSAREQVHILQDSAPSVWIFAAQYAERVQEVCASLATLPILVCIDTPTSPLTHAYQDYRQLVSQAASTRPALIARSQDTIFLVYTSGTTGQPKGVMHNQRAQLEQTKSCSNIFAANPQDCALLVMPFYHLGAISIYLSYAWAGGAVAVHRAFDANQVLTALAQLPITAAHLAPIMIQTLLDAPSEQLNQPNHLHTVIYSSAPMPVPLLKRAIQQFGQIFVQVYGMTESMLGTCLYKHQHMMSGEPHAIKRLASAGQPYFGCQIVLRKDDGSPCSTNEVGEITILSDATMQGYWNNSVATHQTLRDGWCYTGDMGYFDESNFLFLVDRKKDMIISGGENIYSREVEEALLTHAAVFEAAVVGVPDEKWGESVMAFVVCRETQPTPLELVEHCRNQIASYKKPKYLTFIEALPRVASTNKVDKKALRAQALCCFATSKADKGNTD